MERRRKNGSEGRDLAGAIAPLPPHIQQEIRRVSQLDESRFNRFRVGRRLVIHALEPEWRWIARVATAPLIPVGRVLSKLTAAGRSVRKALAPKARQAAPTNDAAFSHPFRDGDIVFSAGFMMNDKERVIGKVKETGARIALGYLIYDVILIAEATRHYYLDIGIELFQKYFDWVASNCDFIIYGGETARRDSLLIQQERSLPSPPSAAIKFGSNLGRTNSRNADDVAMLEQMGVTGKFMMSVGSIEGRKNHETLYRAYVMLIEKMGEAAPQLVFVGRPDPYSTSDLIDTLNRDPRIKDRLLVLQPSDAQLDVLYRHCEFTLLPTLYEGWSLTLPESLGYGKLCICSDVEPLREIGGDLVDYVAPWDVAGWRDRMEHYSVKPGALAKRAANIVANWESTTWNDCGIAVDEAISTVCGDHGLVYSTPPPKRPVWVDLTLSYLIPQKGISGVIRAELLFAREFHKINPEVRFFACDRGIAFEIPKEKLEWLFYGDNLSADFTAFNQAMNELASRGIHRSPYMSNDSALVRSSGRLARLRAGPRPCNFWDAREGSLLIASALPTRWQRWLYRRVERRQQTVLEEQPASAAISQSGDMGIFQDGAVVFFAGIDWTLTALRALRDMPNRGNVFLAHVLYDMTPTITPQLHVVRSPPVYLKFLELVSDNFDFIFYGGRTAQRDARLIQQENGFKSPDSVPIHFGGDITHIDHTPEGDRELLQAVGVTGKFLLAVGTIENRKNHDTLYKAYLTLLERGGDVPQMVFVGGQGWHTGDFMNRITRDERVKGRIIITRASDAQLDALYRHCEFTLLASLYEGWSLTLPESLEYGKFCLVSDVDPLREVGGALVDYVHPWDVMGWADKIRYYLDHPVQLKKRANAIKRKWKTYSWEDCARDVYATLQDKAEAHFSGGGGQQASVGTQADKDH